MDFSSIKADQNKSWQKIVAKYQNPQFSRSVWQLVNTLVPYTLLWVLMYKCLEVSYWLVLSLSIFAAGLLVRVFIIFHDCGHGSFFKSRRANHFWGILTGILTFTPYQFWWHSHAVHHSQAGDLDNRGWGDVWTMTVQEYLKASRWVRIKYRFARNPICLFIIGPSILFLIVQRLPFHKSGKREINSIHMTNLGILLMGTMISFFIGLKAYLLIQLPVIMIAASAGVWLFYVQHQFEGVYWERHEEWDYVTEAMHGSSYLKLPKVLQWFTGNIGFHHIHHLCPRIPNYFLERCYKENPMFQEIKAITFLTSLKSLTFRLWDEQNKKLVSFGHLKHLKQVL
ncbi:MAG: fatty acid desaturase [Candidatus Omnitrophica bacterium]|nr:fatty acid desaturase [Candidatus Omnitrophota bacterium]